MARRRRSPISLKPFLTLIVTLGVLGATLYIPPSNIFYIVGYIILVSGCAYLISTYLAKNPLTHFLSAFFVLAFLTSNFIAGFNLLNTLLLVSFIIGVRLLFR